MKMTISSNIMYNEEALDQMIENFTKDVLAGTLEEKQLFLVHNGLASVTEEVG